MRIRKWTQGNFELEVNFFREYTSLHVPFQYMTNCLRWVQSGRISRKAILKWINDLLFMRCIGDNADFQKSSFSSGPTSGHGVAAFFIFVLHNHNLAIESLLSRFGVQICSAGSTEWQTLQIKLSWLDVSGQVSGGLVQSMLAWLSLFLGASSNCALGWSTQGAL